MRFPNKSVRCKKSPPAWHDDFLAMVPKIERHARHAFRALRAEARAEAVQEVVCNACAAFARLVELDKIELAYPTALALWRGPKPRWPQSGRPLERPRRFVALLPAREGHHGRPFGPLRPAG